MWGDKQGDLAHSESDPGLGKVPREERKQLKNCRLYFTSLSTRPPPGGSERQLENEGCPWNRSHLSFRARKVCSPQKILRVF